MIGPVILNRVTYPYDIQVIFVCTGRVVCIISYVFMKCYLHSRNKFPLFKREFYIIFKMVNTRAAGPDRKELDDLRNIVREKR